MGAGRIKGGLLRCKSPQNPHNRQGCSGFEGFVRLASHPFMHPL